MFSTLNWFSLSSFNTRLFHFWNLWYSIDLYLEVSTLDCFTFGELHIRLIHFRYNWRSISIYFWYIWVSIDFFLYFRYSIKSHYEVVILDWFLMTFDTRFIRWRFRHDKLFNLSVFDTQVNSIDSHLELLTLDWFTFGNDSLFIIFITLYLQFCGFFDTRMKHCNIFDSWLIHNWHF